MSQSSPGEPPLRATPTILTVLPHRSDCFGIVVEYSLCIHGPISHADRKTLSALPSIDLLAATQCLQLAGKLKTDTAGNKSPHTELFQTYIRHLNRKTADREAHQEANRVAGDYSSCTVAIDCKEIRIYCVHCLRVCTFRLDSQIVG